jgi:chaperonin cofactor prefoldin
VRHILDMAPQNNGMIAKLLSIAQIITFVVTAIYVVANTNAATEQLKQTVMILSNEVAMLRDDYRIMSERVIKLETRLDDEQRRNIR